MGKDVLYPLLIRVKWGNNKYIRARMLKKLTSYIRSDIINGTSGINTNEFPPPLFLNVFVFVVNYVEEKIPLIFRPYLHNS